MSRYFLVLVKDPLNVYAEPNGALRLLLDEPTMYEEEGNFVEVEPDHVEALRLTMKDVFNLRVHRAIFPPTSGEK